MNEPQDKLEAFSKWNTISLFNKTMYAREN